MSKKNINPYARKRRKSTKVDNTKQNPFDHELKNKRNKRVVYFVIGLIVVVMVGGMVFPYISGSNTKNYSLPTSVLEGEDAKREVIYSPAEISVGQSLTRIDDEYYVLFGSSSDTSELSVNLTKLPVYTVDKDKEINRTLTENLTDKSDKPKNASDIKVYDKVALIKVKKGKITDYISGKSAIEKYEKK